MREKISARSQMSENIQKPAAAPSDSEMDFDSGESVEEAADKKLGLGQAIHIIGNQEHGIVLFQQYCMRCHGPEGKVNPSDVSVLPGVPSLNPIRKEAFNKSPADFARNIDPVLQHGAQNNGDKIDMPPFGDTHELTQAQIADLEAYVLHLNGVERTQIIHPGVEPKKFFSIVLSISVLSVILLGIYWRMVRREEK
jgi:hypothetical protein